MVKSPLELAAGGLATAIAQKSNEAKNRTFNGSGKHLDFLIIPSRASAGLPIHPLSNFLKQLLNHFFMK